MNYTKQPFSYFGSSWKAHLLSDFYGSFVMIYSEPIFISLQIIRKQKNKAEQMDASFQWPQSRSSSGLTSVTASDQSMPTFPGSRRGSYTLWVSFQIWVLYFCSTLPESGGLCIHVRVHRDFFTDKKPLFDWQNWGFLQNTPSLRADMLLLTYFTPFSEIIRCQFNI